MTSSLQLRPVQDVLEVSSKGRNSERRPAAPGTAAPRTEPRTEAEGAPPGAVWADSPEAHRYRQRVAAELRESGWWKRAHALEMCGRAGVELRCGPCGAPNIVPFRCGARTCPTCARAAAAAIVSRIRARAALFTAAAELEAWDGPGRAQARGWKLLTLTRRPGDPAAPFDLEQLRGQVRQARRLFARWWRRTPWGAQRRDRATGRKRSRRDTAYVIGLEVSPGGMVHVHVAIYGEYVHQRQLLAWWRGVLDSSDRTDGGVRVNALRGDLWKALAEVLKYSTKGQADADGGSSMPAPARAAAVELAFRDVRRIDVGGALRRFATPDDTELTADDLHDRAEACCEACGTIGEWHWAGIVSPHTVTLNGRFGLLAVEAADVEQWKPPPDVGYCAAPPPTRGTIE